jgi:lysophospholipase L1-like esterase
MRDMPKKPPQASTGHARDRGTIAFWVFIVLAVVAGAGMYRAATTRGPADTGYRSSHTSAQATSTQATPAVPAPTTAPGGTSAPAPVAILGDPYSGGPGFVGIGEANWTKLLAKSLAAAGKPIDLSVFTDSSAGYVKPTGGDGTALAQQVSQTVKPDDRVVVVFPSPSDSEQSRDAVRSAARGAYAQIKSTAPGATLIVVGQSWTSDTPPSNVTGLHDTLRAEAAAAGAVFVDPLTDKWFVNDTGKLVSSDGVHLTDQGHKYLADQLQPPIAAALG